MSNEPKRIDPRGPRFGAGITALISLVSFYLAANGDFWSGYYVMVAIFGLFVWSVFLTRITHPYAWLFKRTLAPRLAPPTELEDPRPPQFAQKVGLAFATIGVASFFLGQNVTVLAVAAAFIFIAAFLNSVFGLCLGCQMYLILKRFGVIR